MPELQDEQRPGSQGNSSDQEEHEGDSSLEQTQETRDQLGGQGSEGEGEGSERPLTRDVNFSHPRLRGKSPEEIEQLFSLAEDTIRSQNSELNTYHDRLNAVSQEKAPSGTTREGSEELPDYEDNFLRPGLQTLERRIMGQLEKTVAPLREELGQGRAQTAREVLRKELRYFDALEPTIDKTLREGGVRPDSANEGQLRQIYHNAVGIATEKGWDLNSLLTRNKQEGEGVTNTNSSNNNRQQESSVGIAQRRPSSAPLPETSSKPKLRQLTEQERRLAREFGMTEKEYLEEQSRPDDEVVSPGFSRDNW